jgi:carbonic anhydrase/acetyltransferase-like protein (isoleucine patch superfamily)
MLLEYDGKYPRIAEAVYIAPGAAIIGDVTLADDVSVWFNAVLRADLASVRVGRETNIQDNCTIHTDLDIPATIGAGVTIGHNAVIHGCTIEDNCLIGINAVILNGAHIHKGSIVASGSVVREGQVVGPYHLMAGVPAVLKKQMAPAEADRRIAHARDDYLKLKAGYTGAAKRSPR